MKKRYILLTLSLILLSISHVKAETCDTTDIERLTVIANNVDLSYSIEEYIVGEYNPYEYDMYTYKFDIANLTKELYAVNNDTYNRYVYNYQNNQNGIVSQYQLFGGTYKIEIYSVNCNKKLRTIEITLPYYNQYYNSETCSNIDNKNLIVCQEWTKNYVDKEAFEEGMKNYNQNKNEVIKNENNNLLQLLNNNYIYIIAIAFIVITIIIIAIINKKRGELK